MKHAAARDMSVGARSSCVPDTTGSGPLSHSDLMANHLDRAVPLAKRREPTPFDRLAGIDARAFKMWFAPKLAEYLRSQFRSPEHVAYLFNVRHSTAYNWWNGDNRASGLAASSINGVPGPIVNAIQATHTMIVA